MQAWALRNAYILALYPGLKLLAPAFVACSSTASDKRCTASDKRWGEKATASDKLWGEKATASDKRWGEKAWVRRYVYATGRAAVKLQPKKKKNRTKQNTKKKKKKKKARFFLMRVIK